MTDGGGADGLRLHATRAYLALMRGELDDALDHVAGFERLADHVDADNPIEQRFATVGARVMLAARRFDEARTWLARARMIHDPPVMRLVTIPAL